MSKIVENVPIEIKCAQYYMMIYNCIEQLIMAQKFDNRKYIPQLLDIAQKYVCSWNEHMDVSFLMN